MHFIDHWRKSFLLYFFSRRQFMLYCLYYVTKQPPRLRQLGILSLLDNDIVDKGLS